MKTKNYLFILFFLPSVWMCAQPQISRIISKAQAADGTWPVVWMKIYEYDLQNRKTAFYQYGGEPEDAGVYFNGQRWKYDDAGRVVSEIQLRRDSTGQIYEYWQLVTEYDANGCISSHEARNLFPAGIERDYSRQVYSYGADCQRDTMWVYRCNPAMAPSPCDLIDMWTDQYLNGGKTVRSSYHEWDQILDTFYTIENINIKTYDDEGRLLEDYSTITDIGPEKLIYTWHPDGKMKSEEYWRLEYQGNWKLYFRSEYDYEYEFNDLQQVVKQTSYYRYHDFETGDYHEFADSSNIDYYCDGLRRSTWSEGSVSFYEYTEGADCHVVEGEVAVLVFPNPATNTLNIQSADFRTGEVKLRIFNAIGQPLERQQILYRTENAELDLSDLPNGTYFLQVETGGKTTSRKIIVSK